MMQPAYCLGRFPFEMGQETERCVNAGCGAAATERIAWIYAAEIIVMLVCSACGLAADAPVRQIAVGLLNETEAAP